MTSYDAQVTLSAQQMPSHAHTMTSMTVTPWDIYLRPNTPLGSLPAASVSHAHAATATTPSVVAQQPGLHTHSFSVDGHTHTFSGGAAAQV